MPPFRPRRSSSVGLWRARLRRWLRSALAIAVLMGAMWLLWGQPPQGTRLSPAGGGVRAVDGDSFVMATDAGDERLRLSGIDAPEYRQLCRRPSGAAWPCGADSRAALAALLAEPDLACDIEAEDRFARKLARCRTARTPDIGAAMVAAGLAITNGRGEFPDYWLEEQRAEAAKRGLWQGSFERPADWRRANPR